MQFFFPLHIICLTDYLGTDFPSPSRTTPSTAPRSSELNSLGSGNERLGKNTALIFNDGAEISSI